MYNMLFTGQRRVTESILKNCASVLGLGTDSIFLTLLALFTWEKALGMPALVEKYGLNRETTCSLSLAQVSPGVYLNPSLSTRTHMNDCLAL
jgi:hypothetical protein